MSTKGIPKPLDFTANGVVVAYEVDNEIVAWTLNGDGNVSTLSFTAGEGNVAASLTGQTGTFGSGTMVLEATNLSWEDLGVTQSAWSTNTNGGYWEAVSVGGSAYSVTASSTSWIDAPFRFLRWRLTGATNPRIKGKYLVVRR